MTKHRDLKNQSRKSKESILNGVADSKEELLKYEKILG